MEYRFFVEGLRLALSSCDLMIEIWENVILKKNYCYSKILYN